MADIANFRFNDPGRAFDESYGRVNALRTDRARMSAGNALSGGDYGGAANALYGAGELEMGSRVQGIGESRQAAAAKAQKDRETEVLDFTGEMAGRLSTILDESKDDPNAAVGAFDTFFAPRLMQMGETPEEIAQVRQQLASNARQTLLALGAGAAKALGYDTSVVGEELLVVDKATGQLVNRFRGARTVNVGEGGALYEIPGTGGQSAPFDPRVPAQPGASPEDLAGAEQAARAAGVPWRPDLMRGDTPAADEYRQRLTASPAGGSVEEMQSTISAVLPGARFTSGLRTPERNRAVGGAPNSYHLRGQALDIVPPAGMTTAQAAEAIRASGQYAEVIDEGDHVHVAWSGQRQSAPLAGAAGQDQLAGGGEQAGGPRLLVNRPKAAKESVRPATAEEKAAYGISPEIPAARRPDGSIDVISGVGATQKRVPHKIQEGYVGNNSSLRQIDEAIASIKANPKAFGLIRGVGENINQRVDPGGVAARAAVANIGSQLIHDRSGAAVTAAEAPRLMPFIPRVTDTAEAAIIKLQSMRKQYENANSEIEVAYGEDSGYSPLASTQGRSNVPPASAVQYLRSNPNLREAFDAKYGKGAAAKALGR